MTPEESRFFRRLYAWMWIIWGALTMAGGVIGMSAVLTGRSHDLLLWSYMAFASLIFLYHGIDQL